MSTATQRTTQSSYGAMNSASNDFDQYINYATVYVGHPPNDEDSNGYVARFRFPSIAFASVISDLRLYLYFKDGWTASTRVYVSSNANLTPYQVVNGSATLLGARSVSPADGGALTTDKWYVMSLTDYGDTINDFAGVWYLYLYRPASSAGRSEFQGGVGSNGAYLDLTYSSTTACTPPTSGELSTTLAEINIDVTLYGAGNGIGNTVNGAEFQYSDSTDNGVTWGTWISLKTMSAAAGEINTTLAIPSSRGTIRKYRVQIRGTAGSSYYSTWYNILGTVRRDRVPVNPTAFAAAPTLRESGPITLTFSGYSDPDGNYDHQEIQRAIKPKAGSYGAFAVLKNATGGSTTDDPALSDGDKVKYQTRSVDALGVPSSSWIESNEVTQNSAPLTPVILFPVAGRTTYNVQPYIGFSISAEPDGQTQTLYYSIDGGSSYNAGTVTAGTKKIRMPALTTGSHALRFWLQDSQGAASGEASVTITIAANTYTRDITGYVSAQQPGTLLWDEENELRTSTEILELKSRVNQIRAYYGLSAISLPYEATTGASTIKHFHTWMLNFAALYQGMADTGTVSGASVPARVIKERNAPSAAVVNQIRSMIGSL